jgi:hypothetical protein
MGYEDDEQHPLWPVFDTPQDELWVLFYKGMSGKWIATSPFYLSENVERMAANYDRPMKILKYTLSTVTEVDTRELRAKHRPPKVRIPKVRKPLRVRKPLGG